MENSTIDNAFDGILEGRELKGKILEGGSLQSRVLQSRILGGDATQNSYQNQPENNTSIGHGPEECDSDRNKPIIRDLENNSYLKEK